MIAYMLRRLAATIPVMLVVAILVFLMLRLTPGDPAAIIAATAASLSVSDILRWPADDQVSEYRTPDLYAIGLANGGGHAIQRLADQYARVRSDRRRQLRGDALRDDWTTWVKGCAEKWAKP